MIIFVIIGLTYLTSILISIVTWHRISTVNPFKKSDNLLSVSVIAPVRNEESHIAELLRQLESQNYPKEFFEIIVVNDHSEDQTESIVSRVIESTTADMRLISLPMHKTGKKAALLEGINSSKGEIIITTDGDCQVGNNWIKSMTATFGDTIMMTFGPVAIKKEGILSQLQIIDFAALIGMGAVSWKLGNPGMCNGANLAFRKSTFLECKGYEGTEQYPSGDDEFLLRKIHKRYPNGIQFAKNDEAIVFTNPLPDVYSLFQQRTRWAGKWKLHEDRATKILAASVFFFYIIMLALTIGAFYVNKYIDIVIGFWIMKWFLDILLVGSVLKLSKERLPIIASLILSIIYPFYTIVIGISSINYTFEWKGRRY